MSFFFFKFTAEYVYTTDAPPPYPGVDPAYPPPQAMANGMSSAGERIWF